MAEGTKVLPAVSPPLRVGKLPIRLLERLLRRYRILDDSVILGPDIGIDATVVEFGNKYLILKTDPITFVAQDLGYYAVVINSNDVAVLGAKPKWFLVTLLLPEGSTTEQLVEHIFKQIKVACRRLNISFVGGHTEITYGLSRPILIGQLIGEVSKKRLIRSDAAKPKDDLILTKGIAIEGTSVIAREQESLLIKAGYKKAELRRLKNFIYKPGISILKEAAIASKTRGVNAMHDPTEGGIATGLYELAKASGVGLLVYFNRIKIFEATKALCQKFSIDPLGLIASGALIISVEPDKSNKLIKKLTAEGIPSAIIGKVMPKKFGTKLLLPDNKLINLPRFEQDEITKIYHQR